LLPRGLEELPKLTLPPANERRQDLEARARVPAEHHVRYLRRTLLPNRPATVRAVRRTGARVKEPQVVVDLCYRTHGGARVVAGALLLDGDRWGKPLDHVHVGLLHQPQELARVRAQRLHVPSLPLGIYGIESQG